MGLLSVWLKKETNIPVVVTLHGLEVVFPNKIYQNKILPKLKKLDAFICVSQSTANLTKQKGFDASKIYVVANGVDPELASLKTNKTLATQKIKQHFNLETLDNKKILISLGRMTKRKGFTWFLENVVPKLDENTIFVLAGPDANKKQETWKKILPSKLTNEIELAFGAVDESHTLNKILQEKKIENKVFITGKLPFIEVMSLLSLAHLFVMPNISVKGDAEGFGLVALEASIVGTTVLASGIEGITQAIQHNKNGILLPSKDENAWINCINEQLSDFKKLEQQSKTFQKFTIENYTWEKMANGYVEVFEQILETNS